MFVRQADGQRLHERVGRRIFRSGTCSCSTVSARAFVLVNCLVSNGAISIGARGSFYVQRAWVRAACTTPKNHEDREVDLSRELRAQLWLWRRRQAAEALKHGRSRPTLVFPSVLGTPLDYSNVHKEFAAIMRKAELRHRTPYAMRHSFVSLLLQKGASL